MTIAFRSFCPRFGVAILSLSALVLIAGCGKSSGNVSGKVTLDGQPLKGGGTVTFQGSKGGVSGTISPEGSYTISNVPPGEVKITLAPGMATGAVASATPGDPGKMQPPKTLAPPAPVLPHGNIPEKYTKPETSGLTYTVKSGNQTFDIPLTR
jgi:hypothetical protein